jgi:fumarate hydratase subunit alpha
MRTIEYQKIVAAVKDMCLEANYDLPQDVMDCFEKAVKSEESPLGRSILEQCIENAKIAKNEKVPICQDTGLSVFFVKLGADLKIEGGILPDAINEASNRATSRATSANPRWTTPCSTARTPRTTPRPSSTWRSCPATAWTSPWPPRAAGPRT